MEVSGQFHAPVTLVWGKSPWYLLDRGLGGHQIQSGCDCEEKESFPALLGTEPQSFNPILYSVKA